MVQFGTSGWRGIIGREVTFRAARIVIQAILDTLRARDPSPNLIVIGYDTRMLSEKFAETATELVAANGIRVELTPRDVPSPVLAAAVIERRASAGITFTASHNPPEYNGLKFYTADGILAGRELTDQVERRYDELEPEWRDVFLPDPELVASHDPRPSYLAGLRELIDWQTIRDSGLQVVVDPLFGTAREYLDHVLLENEIPVTVIHNSRDPYFGGYSPECTSENLSRLRDVMRRTGAELGLATDGDGDRFGIVGYGARMLDSTSALALLLDYLIRHRGLEGGVGRTIASSRIFDAIAAEHGLEMIETPVGFRDFGPLLVDGTLEFAGEESAGLAWSRHLPERDGILACLLTAEMMAVEGKSLTELKQQLADRYGAFAFRRTQLALTDRVRELVERRFAQEEWNELGGRTIVAVDRSDGLRLTFEGGGWILVRLASTEPKVRLYAEGRSNEELRHLMHLARQLTSNGRL